MLGLFESFFKKKPKYDIEALRKAALRDLEENYHPRQSIMFSVEEPVSEYSVSRKDDHSDAQFMTWNSGDDPLAGVSLAQMSEAEMKALRIVLDKRRDKTFSELLFQYIRDRGYRDTYVYKRAQADKRLFSKIRSDRDYKPARDTVIAFALALQCSLDEADRLLKSAGFQLSESNRRDFLIRHFFINHVYDLITINEILDGFGEKIIGREKVG